MNAGKKILIGFAVLVGIVILFGAIGKASQDKPRPEADICTSGYDALDADTRFECAKKKHLNVMTGGHPKAVAALSTYGLYFVVAVLAFVSYKLFVKTSSLEREFRGYMQRETEASKQAHEKLLADSAAALNASTLALKDSTDALNRIAVLMERMK